MPRMTAIEKYEATEMAAELLAQLYSPAQVRKALQAQFVIQPPAANSILKEAQQRLISGVERNGSQRRSEHVARLEALYRRAAKANRLTVCEAVLRQLGRIWGVDEPTRVVHSGTVNTTGDMDQRSDFELAHFVQHGVWPGESKTTATAEQSLDSDSDPLLGLH